MTAIIKFNVLLNWFNEQSSTTLTWTDLDGPILYLYIHICSYWCLAVSLTLKAKALFSPMKCSLVKTRCSMLSMLIPGVEGFLWHLYCLSTHNNSSPFRREMNLMTIFYDTIGLSVAVRARWTASMPLVNVNRTRTGLFLSKSEIRSFKRKKYDCNRLSYLQLDA